MQPENRIVNNIRKALDKKGAKTVKMHGGAISSHAPDIIGCLNGQFFAIEVKQQGEWATSGQVYELIQWARSGAKAGVAHSVEEAFLILGIKDK